MRAADLIAAIGFAIAGTRSAISGAEPCTGSPRMNLSPALTEGTKPSEPTNAAAPSEMISP